MSHHAEDALLLPIASKRLKFLKIGFCMKSKILVFILLWIFAVLLIYQLFGTYSGLRYRSGSDLQLLVASFISIVTILAPLAGLLTDIKYSRYKTVKCSSFVLIINVVLFLFCFITMYVCYKFKVGKIGHSDFDKVLAAVFYFFSAGAFIIASLIPLISLVQFGMDQLHDSPTEDSILFIHWYVWIYHLCLFVAKVIWNLIYARYPINLEAAIPELILILLLFCIVLLILAFALYVVKCKVHWFHIEPPGVNPYKLVFRVTKFAWLHKMPLRRSAFTYCEDELPSRMDLGKQKYGGPFTTKEVEDVKAFWGILKVVSSLGPTYLIQFAAHSYYLSLFAMHNIVYKHAGKDVYVEGTLRHIFLSNGLLSPLLIVVCIPFYLRFIRPHFLFHFPGMLKRIGLGIVIIILSLILSLAMDVVVHKKEPETNCMLTGITGSSYDYANITTPPLHQNAYFFISQQLLSSLANMLFDIAILELVLSQSPYLMKGLLLGYLFSMRSLFQAMAIFLSFPFGRFKFQSTLSCGTEFYLAMVIVGIVNLALYTVLAKKYQYRTVNEPCNEYRYAEEYYSNIQ